MIDERSLDVLFRDARSQNGWRDEPVADSLLVHLYDLVKLGPTSANSTPARFLFLRTPAAKERLRPYLAHSNVEKVMSAPVTAIIGYDTHFYELLPRLFPHNASARDWFAGEAKASTAVMTAFRNGSLQGGYFILAARAIGLDCGPMSGFDHEGVDREFWRDTNVRTNFLCALGIGDPSKVFSRHPRLTFDEACELL